MTNGAAGEGKMNLLDEYKISDLIHHYFQVIDDECDDEVAGFFTEDGVFDGITGRFVVQKEVDNFLTGLKAMREGDFTNMRHFATGIRVNVNGDEATARCSILVTATDAAGLYHIAGTGEMQDRLFRTETGWKFAERIVKVDGQRPHVG